MNEAKANIAITMMGKYFPMQLIYQDIISRRRLRALFPEAWDIVHSKITG